MKTYRAQYVRCGKKSCKSCPHGPYWYAFEKVQRKTRSYYIGKVMPDEVLDAPPRMVGRRHWFKILHRHTATMKLACEILEVDEVTSRDVAARSFKRLYILYHPDCGGSHSEMSCLNAAWTFFKTANGWK